MSNTLLYIQARIRHLIKERQYGLPKDVRQENNTQVKELQRIQAILEQEYLGFHNPNPKEPNE